MIDALFRLTTSSAVVARIAAVALYKSEIYISHVLA
jgi:hypothetical protein